MLIAVRFAVTLTDVKAKSQRRYILLHGSRIDGFCQIAGGRKMSRSVIVGVLVSLPMFFALLDGEFLVILVALIGGYVVHTLLT